MGQHLEQTLRLLQMLDQERADRGICGFGRQGSEVEGIAFLVLRTPRNAGGTRDSPRDPERRRADIPCAQGRLREPVERQDSPTTMPRSDLDDRLIIELDDSTAANLDELDEPTWSGDLVTCRQIVQAHGGSLEVERPANGGYRFHLELPVTAADAGLQYAAAP